MLTLTDIDDGTQIIITSPMSKAELKGAHPIQNLGAVETYQRRYLWMTAMEIVEHDALDSSKPADRVKPAEEDDEEVAARLSVAEPPKKPKFTPTARVKADVIPPPYVETSPEWTITIHAKDQEDWGALLISTTKLKLTFATSEEQVREMFKVNRSLYDTAKVDLPEVYGDLMDMFKAANKKFKDQ
jgi:hypothetical protein